MGMPFNHTRRDLLATVLGPPLALVLAGAGARAPRAETRPLALTPDCAGERIGATEAAIEGPFFKPRSPQRQSLIEAGMTGVRLVLTGFVLSPDCRPIPGALVDFWQADANGEYDNKGCRLRGHQLTDASGRYMLETVVPGAYDGRTRHAHVKVQAPQARLLTTQLYFPGEPRNSTDPLFRSALLLRIGDAGDGGSARFDFVVNEG